MSKQQRLVLVISILASFVAFLDGSVVNVALPAITKDLGGGLAVQQWVTDAYLITLGSLILIAGSFSDLLGRKKILMAGLIGFLVTSIMCAIAPSSTFLIISRGLQGIAGAMLVPSSLALIISAFSDSAEAKAIGTWTAWVGVAFVVGPLLGGFLVDAASWRMIFAINVVPILVTVWLLSHLKLADNTSKNVQLDVAGAILCALGLGGPVYALIEQSHYGWSNPLIYLPMILGLVCLGLFIQNERRHSQPMLPLGLFKIRNFWVGNIATTSIYAGLNIATFLIIIFLQQQAGYSALQAGLAFLPVTIIMFILSPRFGAMAGKYGPRAFMAIGPVIAGLGFLDMLRVSQPILYWSQLFPGVLIFGLGLSITVAPLTAAILGSIEKSRAGIASAVNNAISRIAGLIGIAVIGLVTSSKLNLTGFHRGIALTAALLIIGGLISAAGIVNSARLKNS